MNEKLKGILAALLTPFDREGNIDTGTVKMQVKDLLERGIDGFFVCGTAGEGFLMDGNERKQVIEAVMEANEGKGSVICHCGAMSTSLSADLAKHAASLGVDAVAAVPPFYYHYTNDEIIRYFYDLADACGKPVIVYNIPSFCGVTISPLLMTALRKHPGITGIKFTSNDFFSMEQIKSADPSLLVYNGLDEYALAGFSMGADGAIGSNFNVMEKYFLKLWELFKQNRIPEAQDVQRKANRIITALLSTGKLIPCIKYMVGLKGIPHGECRAPFAALSEDNKRVCQEAFNTLKLDRAV
jgi:N-acetylneuraminate lyase